jgi:cation diffusion facilitator family transporter
MVAVTETEPMAGATGPGSLPQARRAIRLSLIVGIGMLFAKAAAFAITGSAAVFADMAESLIHNIGVGFAAFSIWLSARPANSRYLFGYERVAFFSAGFEGGLILLAGIATVYTAIQSWIAGPELSHLSWGTLITFGAALVNLLLGVYLVRAGRKINSIILEANGHHVLSDSYTSFGAVLGLLLVLGTGVRLFDPLAALILGFVILWSGWQLIRRSVTGLLDYADPLISRNLRQHLDAATAELNLRYHDLRFRFTGQRLLVQVHLLFPYRTPIGEAHRIATELEDRLSAAMGMPTEVSTHLEALEDHGTVHHTPAEVNIET